MRNIYEIAKNNWGMNRVGKKVYLRGDEMAAPPLGRQSYGLLSPLRSSRSHGIRIVCGARCPTCVQRPHANRSRGRLRS